MTTMRAECCGGIGFVSDLVVLLRSASMYGQEHWWDLQSSSMDCSGVAGKGQ